MTSPLASSLADPTRPALKDVAKIHQASVSASLVGDLNGRWGVIPAMKASRSVPAVVLATEWIAPTVAGLPAEKPGDVLRALSGLTHLSERAVRRYLKFARERFGDPGPDAPVHAAALWLACREDWAQPHDREIRATLALAARRWPPEALEETATAIDSVRKTDGKEFRKWRDSARHGRWAVLVRACRGVRRLVGKAARRGNVISRPQARPEGGPEAEDALDFADSQEAPGSASVAAED
jgi:hypothetical protein